jgi:hypothetical protein
MGKIKVNSKFLRTISLLQAARTAVVILAALYRIKNAKWLPELARNIVTIKVNHKFSSSLQLF